MADFSESGQEQQRVTLSPHGKKPLRKTHLEEQDGTVISSSSQVPGKQPCLKLALSTDYIPVSQRISHDSSPPSAGEEEPHFPAFVLAFSHTSENIAS